MTSRRAKSKARSASCWAQGSLFEFDPKTAKASFETINLRKRPVRARTAAQDSYIRALKAPRDGVWRRPRRQPARHGLRWRMPRNCSSARKSIASSCRDPRSRAGERLGFLPGDLREKVDPYLRADLRRAVRFDGFAQLSSAALQAGEIEIAPLAFHARPHADQPPSSSWTKRRTTTSMQMKMFLTRLGENSRNDHQPAIRRRSTCRTDRPPGLPKRSSCSTASRALRMVKFTAEDVIRHELVARIVAAYEGLPQKPATNKS